MTPYRARARHRRRAGRAVRRQRRLLAVARPAGRGGPPAARRHVPDQRRGRRPAELRAAAAGLANVRFAGYVPEDRLGELLATGDIHVVPLRARPGRGQRAVEDVLDPRRRPTGRRRDRRRHRGAARCSPRRAPASPCAPDDADALHRAPIAASSTTRSAPPRWARRGRRWVLAAASPAAVAAAYAALIDDALAADGRSRRRRRGCVRGAAGSIAPSWLPHRRRPRRPPGWPRRARARRSASRAAPSSPLVVAIVLVVGLALIVYARASQPGRRRLAAAARHRPLARRLRLPVCATPTSSRQADRATSRSTDANGELRQRTDFRHAPACTATTTA